MRPLPLLLVLLSLSSFAGDPKPKDKPRTASPAPVTPQAPNAVQKEMQALHGLVVTTLVAIENGDTTSIPAAIHQVHEAKGETEKAITSGGWKPPRADATVADFVKTDEAFHGELVKLLQASKKNDVTATTKQLGAVLEGCTSCHVRFRFAKGP
ncbi:MAG: cytochrome c [Myxococcaceae bacterium]|nr:cytochrome c [Myxococcaceae bacterium]